MPLHRDRIRKTLLSAYIPSRGQPREGGAQPVRRQSAKPQNPELLPVSARRSRDRTIVIARKLQRPLQSQWPRNYYHQSPCKEPYYIG